MNDELPEPLNRVTPPAAPQELRSRTLSAVDRELAVRRKPRWERVLELSVAATFVLGVALNASLIRSGIEQIATGGRHGFASFEQDAMVAQDAAPFQTTPESLEAAYARYLAQLSAKIAG